MATGLPDTGYGDEEQPGATGEDVSRRSFMQFALSSAAAFVAGQAEEVLGAQKRKIPGEKTDPMDLNEKERTVEVKELSDGSIYIPAWTAEKNGEGRRGPSKYIVRKYVTKIPVISQNITITGSAVGSDFHCTYLIPALRSIGEHSCDGTIITMPTTGLKDVRLEVTPLISQPNDNLFYMVDCYGKVADKRIVVKPTFAYHDTQPGEVVVPPTEDAAIVQQIENNVRSNTVYDTSNAVLKPAKKGDCGVFAVNASVASGGKLGVVIGWDETSIRSGGRHAWSQGFGSIGNLECDAALHRKVGPGIGRFPATLGTQWTFTDPSAATMVKNKKSGLNGGVFQTKKGGFKTKQTAIEMAPLSIAGTFNAGEDVQWNEFLQQAPAPLRDALQEMRAHSQTFVNERQSINSPSGVSMK